MIIPLKSVIMMIGPSGCGKSKFIKDRLVPQLKSFVPDANIQILSSDGYRREILGKEEKDLSKTDGRMKYASEGAFKLMETKFDAVTTWPITADFIILDATFIGIQTREQFVEKAKKAQYQLVGILFDFNDREEYFKYITDPEHKWLISQHLKRFQKGLGEIGRKDFDYFYKIKGKDHDIKLEKDPSYDFMKLAMLPSFNSYFVVGDLHGCLKEFKELLNSVGFEIGGDDGNRIKGNDDTLIILTGDIPDRGNQVSELIDFILVNIDRIKICKGGHDQYLAKYSETGKIDDRIEKDKLKHFDSSEKLSPADFLKFYKIMKGQWYFYVHKHFVITHSPCENRYIGKFDKFSIRKQRNDSYPRHDDYASEEEYIDDLKKHFSYILNDAKRNDPYHIFGHVAVNNDAIVGNNIFLDTGCVYGNKLTGIWINAEYDKVRLKFKSVQSSYPRDSSSSIINIDDLEIKKDNEIKFESLEFEDKIDILEFAKNKINFISGTMSPCSANRTEKTLEDMREAFSYYRDNGVGNVILQKKYMGSRANMYLFPKDIDKSYTVSRNGFVIRRLNLKPLYEKMLKFLSDKNDKNGILNSELVIIDGELMPWSALGKSLIESHFMTVGKGVESELRLLEETCFESILEDLKKRYDESGYKDLRMEHKREDLKKIVGENQYRQMHSFDSFRWMPIKEQRDAINTYNSQIDIYGKECDEEELDFRPFAILKVVRNDGDELFWDSSNDFVFTTVSDDQCLIVPTDDIGLDSARKWFDKIVKEDYEGAVVKPLEKVYTPGIAPYIKVRNPNYLTIIYGYDYLIEPKFARMLENKNIRNKLRLSIKEFEIGKRMLQIPYNEINENNIEYLNLCAQMVIEEKKEKELDPRL
jgi:predicted kinase